MKSFVAFTLAVATALALSAQTKPAPPKAPPAPVSKPKQTTTPAPAATPAPPAEAAAPAVDPAKTVLTIGDDKITAAEFDTFIEALPEQYRAQARGPMKRQVAEQIIRVKLLAAEARRRGLDKDKTLQSRIQFQSENLLAGAVYNDVVAKSKVEDSAVQKYYDEHKNEFESIEAKHILIRYKGSAVPKREGKEELSEEQALAKAQEVGKQLAAGGDFPALAKIESDDVGSGANGGELGTFSRGQMVPAFEEAAFKLPIGKVSEPIKTQFGYHLIRVEKHDAKPFETVKDDLAQKLKPEAAKASVESLRKNASVVLDDAYFGPEPSAVPPVPIAPPAAPVK